MAYAPNYSPTTDFSQDQANNVSGRSTARTANLDAEFDNISTSINALNNNLKDIQRSDNKLKDGVVEMHTLSDEVMMALGSTPEAVALINQAVLDAQNSANNAENYYNSLIASSLKAWAYSESFALISATRNADNVITSANIKWPDGTSGVFTSTTINSTFNTIDAWSATYLGSTTKTITQSAVTRNLNGAVTAQPEITIA
mgnify:CR=1 FL=1